MHIGGRLTKSKASEFRDVFEYWREVDSEHNGSSRIIDPTDRRTIHENVRVEPSPADDPDEHEAYTRVEDTFSFWEEVLAEIMDDYELESGFAYRYPSADIDSYEEIRHIDPVSCPLPDDETMDVKQDRGAVLRSWKISLQAISEHRVAATAV
ncbi:hypothetical protein PINS_up006579 [Pythium insidiosum]|nr:hypothetical protein PINS_up006579 [Pythium insidiosum]